MTRIGTLAFSNQIRFQIEETFSRLYDRQIQVSSGKVAQRFTGISAEATRVVNLKNTMDGTDQFLRNISLVDDRLEVMESTVSQLTDIATEVRTLLVQSLNAETASSQDLNNLTGGMLTQVAGFLNKEVAGRFLFSGTATNTAPVDVTNATFVATGTGGAPSAVDTSYYQGNTTKLSVRADDNFSVTYGITADESGFEKLLRSINLASNVSVGPPSDRTTLTEALKLVNESIDEINGVVSTIGGSRAAMANVQSKHENFRLIFEEEISGIENVDVVQTMTRLSEDQNALEASFATVARINQLSLINFL
ncbi:MAG: hypothetical protein ISR48_02310 [Alphaproteobacteria bacterium]|nr:hypothetical protein [Alphaproteobacteria bacterium]